MTVSRRIALLLLFALPVHAAEEADEDLLEFLGSVGEEDDDWSDYLGQTDIAKVVKDKAPAKTTPVEPKKGQGE